MTSEKADVTIADHELINWWSDLNHNNKAKFITPHLEMITRGPAKGFKGPWEYISDKEWSMYIQLCNLARRKNKSLGIKRA